MLHQLTYVCENVEQYRHHHHQSLLCFDFKQAC
jgi:hypothetical protein